MEPNCDPFLVAQLLKSMEKRLKYTYDNCVKELLAIEDIIIAYNYFSKTVDGYDETLDVQKIIGEHIHCLSKVLELYEKHHEQLLSVADYKLSEQTLEQVAKLILQLTLKRDQLKLKNDLIKEGKDAVLPCFTNYEKSVIEAQSWQSYLE